MKKNKGLIATLIVGFISFIFVIMDFLALHDIYKESGEYNVSEEWIIVSISLIPIVAFHVLFVIYVVIPFFNKEIIISRNLKRTTKKRQLVKE